MSYRTITYETRGELAVVTLNRPERANALSSELVSEMHDAVDTVEAAETVRVVIITGAGRHFCAGADLKEQDRPGSWLDDLRALFGRIAALDRPTIAAINGAAMGGGCELAIACDLRLMAEGAVVGLPEVKFGALAVAGGTQRLPRLIGVAKAKEMHFTGEPVDAAEAFRIGLVNQVVPPTRLMDRALELGATLAQRPRHALALVKRMIDAGSQLDLKRALEVEAELASTLGSGGSMDEDRKRAAELFPEYRRIFSEDA